jgi:outer membrane protein assembly factor BamA
LKPSLATLKILVSKCLSQFTYLVNFLLIALLPVGHYVFGAQEDSLQADNGTFEQKDIRDLLKKKNAPPKPPKKMMLLVLPNVSSNPANGLLLGVAGTAGWFWGPKETTRVSSLGFNAAYTTKKQFLSFAKSNVYTKDDKFYLQGDWRYYMYNAPTWGLGTNAPDTGNISPSTGWQGADLDETEGAYPLSYNYLRFHEIVSYQVKKNFYLGIGYHLDYYNEIEDELLELDTIPRQLTPHFIYSELNDFDRKQYILSGVSANLVYDTRDNLINAYEGSFVNINYRYNPTFLGSDQNSSSLWMEYRTFHSLSVKTPRHLIGFWFFGNFLVSGNQPYLTLMALGEDQRARSGRGYVAGRFRGEDLIYGEAEYRFPISPRSRIIGGVLFVNFTTASNRSRDIGLFEYIRPGVGFGFRFMLNKNFRTNINLDFGFGQKSKGFYFSGTETF